MFPYAEIGDVAVELQHYLINDLVDIVVSYYELINLNVVGNNPCLVWNPPEEQVSHCDVSEGHINVDYHYAIPGILQLDRVFMFNSAEAYGNQWYFIVGSTTKGHYFIYQNFRQDVVDLNGLFTINRSLISNFYLAQTLEELLSDRNLNDWCKELYLVDILERINLENGPYLPRRKQFMKWIEQH